MLAYVAECGGTEKGIADGVDKNVGVGMAEKPFGVWHLDAAEPKGKPVTQLVDIIAYASAENHIVFLFWESVLFLVFVEVEGQRDADGVGQRVGTEVGGGD